MVSEILSAQSCLGVPPSTPGCLSCLAVSSPPSPNISLSTDTFLATLTPPPSLPPHVVHELPSARLSNPNTTARQLVHDDPEAVIILERFIGAKRANLKDYLQVMGIAIPRAYIHWHKLLLMVLEAKGEQLSPESGSGNAVAVFTRWASWGNPTVEALRGSLRANGVPFHKGALRPELLRMVLQVNGVRFCMARDD